VCSGWNGHQQGQNGKMKQALHGCLSSEALVLADERCGSFGDDLARCFHLLAQKLEHLIEELEPLLLEQNEMGRVGDDDISLDRRMDEIAHQPVAVF
jgi:hypothetical protein